MSMLSFIARHGIQPEGSNPNDNHFDNSQNKDIQPNDTYPKEPQIIF